MRRWGRRMALLLVMACIALANSMTVCAEESPVPFQEPNDDYLLILEARTGPYILADVFFSYEEEHGLFLPLSHLFEIVDFPIKVEPGKKTAKGWFLSEENSFELDLNQLTVLVNGERKPITRDGVRLHYDEIYVDSVLLEQWFPLKFRIDYAQMRLNLVTEKPLPFQQRLKRHENWESYRKRYRAESIEPTDFLKVPAEPFTLPNLSIQSRQAMNKTGRNWHHTSSTTIQAANDLARARFSGATTLAQAADDRTKLTSTRLKLFAQSDEPTLLGALAAREWEVGDIQAPVLPLIGGQSSGRGFSVTNEKASFVSDINNYVLEGDGTVGYDVELYQNNRLTDFQTIGEDGRYRFEDIELRAGLNRFRLAFYGPRGEYFERNERVLIGGGMTNEGAFTYDAALLESGNPLIKGSDAGQAGDHTSATMKMSYGLTRFTTLSGGFYHGPLKGEMSAAANAGLRSAIGPLYLQADAVVQDQGQQAYGLSVRSSLDSFTGILSHEQFRGYDEEERSQTARTTVSMAHNIPIKGIANVNDSWALSHTVDQEKPAEYGVQNRLSVNFRHAALSHQLKATMSRDHGWRDALEGDFSLRYKMGDLALRSQLSYDLDGTPEINNVDLSGTYKYDENLSARINVARRMGDMDRTSLSSEISRQFDRFSLGLSASGDNSGDRSVGLVLRTSLLRDDSSLGYNIYDRSVSYESATLYCKAFQDGNGNGQRDENEKWLPGAVFKVIGQQRLATADVNGVAVFNGLQVGHPVRIALDKGSLNDVFLTPKHELVEVQMTPSHVATYNFAVQQLGAIEGTVLVDGVEQGQVSLELWSHDGKKLQSLESEFDGFFLFEDVLPGDYEIRLNPELQESYRAAIPVTVTLEAEDPYGVVDVELKSLQEPSQAIL